MSNSINNISNGNGNSKQIRLLSTPLLNLSWTIMNQLWNGMNHGFMILGMSLKLALSY
jgi:hypothetical protein